MNNSEMIDSAIKSLGEYSNGCENETSIIKVLFESFDIKNCIVELPIIDASRKFMLLLPMCFPVIGEENNIHNTHLGCIGVVSYQSILSSDEEVYDLIKKESLLKFDWILKQLFKALKDGYYEEGVDKIKHVIDKSRLNEITVTYPSEDKINEVKNNYLESFNGKHLE